ncbi:MAG: CcmD family protein [Bacteroidota bacterium]
MFKGTSFLFLLQDHRQEFLFASEKIYAVMTIVLLIFLGFLTYLLLTSRKVSQLEKQMKEFEDQKS